MISVTATNSSDQRTFSGYGLTTIDVGAPGQNVVSTALGGGIATVSGTSFASPLTAGVIALLYSAPCPSLASLMHNSPTEAAMQIRQALFNGVDLVGNLGGETVTGGRINANTSMQLIMDSCASCPVPYNLAESSAAIGQATLSWNALPGTYNLRYRLVGATNWTEVDGLANTNLALSSLSVCQPYEYQVAADCDTSSSAFSPSFLWTSEGCCTAPISITATSSDTSSAVVHWSAVLASTSYDLRHREIGTTDWTELDGLTGNSVTLNNLPSCSDHEVQMRSSCGATMADWSPSVHVHVAGCGQCIEGTFCASSGDDEYEWIAGVQLGNIDRISAGDGGYADVDVTNQSTELVIGNSYPITLTPGYQGSAFDEYFTVWMDLNRDGQFTANELVFDPGTTVMAPLVGTLTVPATATPGPARMRVVMHYSLPVANGCTTYDFGETEDYCVSLVTTPSGINENPAASAVKVYPQPANEVVNFITGGTGNEELLVMDASGRALLNLPISNGFISLRTQDLSDGLYI
ncbi:MAG: GEVED domain-containing protein, partial [Flavobacteriales bacterium]